MLITRIWLTSALVLGACSSSPDSSGDSKRAAADPGSGTAGQAGVSGSRSPKAEGQSGAPAVKGGSGGTGDAPGHLDGLRGSFRIAYVSRSKLLTVRDVRDGELLEAWPVDELDKPDANFYSVVLSDDGTRLYYRRSSDMSDAWVAELDSAGPSISQHITFDPALSSKLTPYDSPLYAQPNAALTRAVYIGADDKLYLAKLDGKPSVRLDERSAHWFLYRGNQVVAALGDDADSAHLYVIALEHDAPSQPFEIPDAIGASSLFDAQVRPDGVMLVQLSNSRGDSPFGKSTLVHAASHKVWPMSGASAVTWAAMSPQGHDLLLVSRLAASNNEKLEQYDLTELPDRSPSLLGTLNASVDVRSLDPRNNYAWVTSEDAASQFAIHVYDLHANKYPAMPKLTAQCAGFSAAYTEDGEEMLVFCVEALAVGRRTTVSTWSKGGRMWLVDRCDTQTQDGCWFSFDPVGNYFVASYGQSRETASMYFVDPQTRTKVKLSDEAVFRHGVPLQE